MAMVYSVQYGTAAYPRTNKDALSFQKARLNVLSYRLCLPVPKYLYFVGFQVKPGVNRIRGKYGVMTVRVTMFEYK